MLFLRLFIIGLVLVVFSSPALAQMTSETPSERSLIEPTIGVDSQLLFLKRIIERLKMNFAFSPGSRENLQLALTTERINETYALIRHSREDLIEPIMEEYRRMFVGVVGDEDKKISNEVLIYYAQDIPILINLFEATHSERAKRAIRASIDGIQAQLWLVLERIPSQTAYNQINPQLTLACQFLESDANSDNFNQVERAISQEKFMQCNEKLEQ